MTSYQQQRRNTKRIENANEIQPEQNERVELKSKMWLELIPNDLAEMIMDFMADADDLINLAKTCKKGRAIASSTHSLIVTRRYPMEEMNYVRKLQWGKLRRLVVRTTNVPMALIQEWIDSNRETLRAIEVSKCVDDITCPGILNSIFGRVERLPNLREVSYCPIDSTVPTVLDVDKFSTASNIEQLAFVNANLQVEQLVSVLSHLPSLKTLFLGGTKVGGLDMINLEEINTNGTVSASTCSVECIEVTHWKPEDIARLFVAFGIVSFGIEGERSPIRVIDYMNGEPSSFHTDGQAHECAMLGRDSYKLLTLHRLAMKAQNTPEVKEHAQVLFELGAKADVRCPKSRTVIYIACQYGTTAILEALASIPGGKEELLRVMSLPTITQESALFVAALRGSVGCVQLLCNILRERLKYFETEASRETFISDIVKTNSSIDGWSPLHAAAVGGHSSCVTYLLESGLFTTKLLTKDGETPLHIAALGGHISVARTLLEHGADVQAVCRDGKMPFHAAQSRGKLQCAQFFRDLLGPDFVEVVHENARGLRSQRGQRRRRRLGGKTVQNIQTVV